MTFSLHFSLSAFQLSLFLFGSTCWFLLPTNLFFLSWSLPLCLHVFYHVTLSFYFPLPVFLFLLALFFCILSPTTPPSPLTVYFSFFLSSLASLSGSLSFSRFYCVSFSLPSLKTHTYTHTTILPFLHSDLPDPSTQSRL